MPRPSNTTQRRAEIADAMIAVMAAEGYERATIAAVARAAGLTPGLVHYHFRNKEEILVVVVDRLRDRMRRRYQKRLERAGPAPLDHLIAFLDAHVALDSDADPAAVAAWVAIGAEALSQPPIRALYNEAVTEALDELHRLIRACLRHAGRPATGSRRIAAALLSAIEGAYQLAAAAPDTLPRGFAAPTLRQMVRQLLA